MDDRSKFMSCFFEELSLNAWPALQTQHYDGWILRFAEGYTRRSNSISPLYMSTIAPHEKIAICEQMYLSRGLDAVFKITDAVQPANLDALLTEQGYTVSALTSVQIARLDAIITPTIHTVNSNATLTEGWLESYCRLSNRQPIPAIRKVLENIRLPTQFMMLTQGDKGEVAALGLGVIERGYLSLYDIVTAQTLRNRGLGTQLMYHLLHWGKANGASHALLQVMYDNTPAFRLYEKLGFKEIYRYWYRVKPISSLQR